VPRKAPVLNFEKSPFLFVSFIVTPFLLGSVRSESELPFRLVEFSLLADSPNGLIFFGIPIDPITILFFLYRVILSPLFSGPAWSFFSCRGPGFCDFRFVSLPVEGSAFSEVIPSLLRGKAPSLAASPGVFRYLFFAGLLFSYPLGLVCFGFSSPGCFLPWGMVSP